MPTTNHRRELARPLCAVFAALLASCTERDVPGASESDSGASTSAGTSDGPSTSDAEPTTDAPGTASTASTTDAPDTSSTSNTSGPGTSSTSTTVSTTVDTTEPNECVYDDHVIVLTPEAYDAWLHGMGEVGTTGDTTTGDTTTGDTTTGTSTGDTGDTDTTGALEWSTELCNEICDALTSAEAWNIISCEKTDVAPDGTVTILCVEIVQHCDGRSHACITSRGALAHDCLLYTSPSPRD